jgi:MoxR-like ATPase
MALMTPNRLQQYLSALVHKELFLSVMIWGPPGVGKSSIVAQVAQEHQLTLTDLRLSQLAPTDLRGLPVPGEKVSRWLPPDFLPEEGRGILFLDEINMAPPVVQGIAQQLILDRRVGSYVLPEGWFVWAAGNRREDRASVFEMPAPLANRFVHLEVMPDLDSFRSYAISQQFSEHILAFLSFRSPLLHKLDPQRPAWPSPRSWEMAQRLFAAGLDISPAVGEAAASEFQAFLSLYQQLPDLHDILRGGGDGLAFSEEPSVRYAITVGLATRVQYVEQALCAFQWLHARAGAEWLQLWASLLFSQLRSQGKLGLLAVLVRQHPTLAQFLKTYQTLLGPT